MRCGLYWNTPRVALLLSLGPTPPPSAAPPPPLQGTGYYADASSPIAAAPKTPGRTGVPAKLPPQTPALATLSPMRGAEHPKQRHTAAGAA